jgi:hypothetical protein
MDREKELRDILDKKLVGNDVNLIDDILSYLKKRCFICWSIYLGDTLKRSYCDRRYKKLHMDVCSNCINKFHFRKCYKCGIYVDENKCYIIDSLN